MPGPLIYARSKKQLVEKLRKTYGYTRREAELIAEAAWEGKGYYYHRGDGYVVRFSPERDKARGGVIGRGRYRHTYDPIVEVAKRVVEEAVRAAETVAREAERKTGKPVEPEKILKVAFPRKPRLPREVVEITNYVWEELPEHVKRDRRQTWITVMNVVKMLYDWAVEHGFDIKNVDLVHDFDWAQGYHHVKSEVLNKIMVGAAKEVHGLTEEDVEEMMRAYEEDSKILMEYEMERWNG